MRLSLIPALQMPRACRSSRQGGVRLRGKLWIITRPLLGRFLPIFAELFGLSWETSTINNYHPGDSKRSGSGRIESSEDLEKVPGIWEGEGYWRSEILNPTNNDYWAVPFEENSILPLPERLESSGWQFLMAEVSQESRKQIR